MEKTPAFRVKCIPTEQVGGHLFVNLPLPAQQKKKGLRFFVIDHLSDTLIYIEMNQKSLNFPTSLWFQPIWKICSSKWIISPSRGENKKDLSCHHLVSAWHLPEVFFFSIWKFRKGNPQVHLPPAPATPIPRSGLPFPLQRMHQT